MEKKNSRKMEIEIKILSQEPHSGNEEDSYFINRLTGFESRDKDRILESCFPCERLFSLVTGSPERMNGNLTCKKWGGN